MALFIRIQIAFAIVSLLLPTVGWALVLLDLGDPLLMSNIASAGLIGCWMVMPMLSTWCYLKVLADPGYNVKTVLNQYFKKPS